MSISPYSILFGLLISICFFNETKAQQSNLSSLYMYNKYEHIPAYAGLEGSLFVTGNYRSQWQNLEGMPITQSVNAHMPAYFLKGAIGVRIKNRNQGPQGITDFSTSYNYVISQSWGLLSGGLNVGTYQYRLNGSLLRTPDGTYMDGVIDHNDGQLSNALNSTIGFTYGISLFFINNYIESGLSIQQIPSYRSNLEEGSFRNGSLISLYAESPIYIFEQYKISPSVLIQSDLVQTQIDVAVTASYSGNIFGGIGTRGYSSNSFDAILLIAGWKFDKQYSLSYAFDLGVSKLRTVHQGTHEIQLNYNLNKKIGAGLPPKIIFNPRYM